MMLKPSRRPKKNPELVNSQCTCVQIKKHVGMWEWSTPIIPWLNVFKGRNIHLPAFSVFTRVPGFWHLYLYVCIYSIIYIYILPWLTMCVRISACLGWGPCEVVAPCPHSAQKSMLNRLHNILRLRWVSMHGLLHLPTSKRLRTAIRGAFSGAPNKNVKFVCIYIYYIYIMNISATMANIG